MSRIIQLFGMYFQYERTDKVHTYRKDFPRVWRGGTERFETRVILTHQPNTPWMSNVYILRKTGKYHLVLTSGSHTNESKALRGVLLHLQTLREINQTKTLQLKMQTGSTQVEVTCANTGFERISHTCEVPKQIRLAAGSRAVSDGRRKAIKHVKWDIDSLLYLLELLEERML
ncbi:MAG: hypothetical protein CO030_00870 [Candidatus Magasanikbacteria bacterium CG_4_9_14_0_2_um_filter_42_11]|uniref:Uncharacterized protein n=1 Tax=Candidatus Magasanikbacteria bacterium CG_4_9_14_0_2_um_filter_42_11 TaxID=1974643 RepID=A0A2M8FAW6_9BACT|nr:MAG: hypothetical protein COU34_03430 [Candidatus Magasanikbacteria bacterium CG10_big_fil_rev_8_21_14_0_10_43_9]PIY92938.1 MAG: hypothetical protein COY70_00675 [Candidatus Magasanikbacteria bacterium CG_4_10_14_0_8_um_filter_42_12]PJC52819.1 MAG: hypothetical protein CO030_00870 [Candidatus Magasanikbacteria bacterium CG_4_9_14_0_2_um_filter_42_11]